MSALVVEPIIGTAGAGQEFHLLSEERREDFTAWLAALNASVEELVSVEYHMADQPVLRLTRYARDAEGRHLVTLVDEKSVPLTETAEILCPIAPPSWWWPVCPQCGKVSTLRAMSITVRCRSCRMVRLLPDWVLA